MQNVLVNLLNMGISSYKNVYMQESQFESDVQVKFAKLFKQEALWELAVPTSRTMELLST